jgi:type IX secretion system PorP/SprF family membrane protein
MIQTKKSISYIGKYLFLFILNLLFSNEYTKAQDFHLSQIIQSPNLLNPGAIGVYNGWERYAIQQRNQWLGSSSTWMTTGASAEITLLKDMYRPKAHLGVGLQFYNDIGGTSRFGTQSGALNLSGILPLSSGSISLGVQAGFGAKRGDASKLLYESQWNGNEFDPTYVSGEAPGLNSFRYVDAGAGLFYSMDQENTSFSRNNRVKFQLGAAVYHANQPTLQYRSGSGETLHRKYVGMLNFGMDIPLTKWAWEAQGVQFVQGGHFETIVGGVIKRRFEEGSKITGYKQDASVGLGFHARVKDAIVPSLQVEWRGFHFGVSYDVTVSKLRTARGGSTIEFSLSYTNIKHALFTSQRRRR